MFRLKNGLYLDLYFDKDPNELNGETVWNVSETGEEFWEHEKVPQFLFDCGPETNEELISEEFTIMNALDAELPNYIWPAAKPNQYIFYRKDAELAEKKSLTFSEAVDIVAAHMERLSIKKNEK